jgi:hypothetical protein
MIINLEILLRNVIKYRNVIRYKKICNHALLAKKVNQMCRI